MIEKVKEKVVFKKMEESLSYILRATPDSLPMFLKKYQEKYKLSPELLGDFIQKILLLKYNIHKKNPEYKQIILDFAKENRILGLHF